jgi:DNA mismatch repair protein MutL
VAPLGQFLESYILASDRGTLLIVDQHVAHERVLFEKLLRAGAGGTAGGTGSPGESANPMAAQRLLMPLPIELAAGERLLADTVLEALRDVGFEVDGFGEGALLLRSVPAELEGTDPERLLREVLSDLRDHEPVVARADLRRRIAASTACHAAIKVHFPLTAGKMAWLLGELFRCETPTTCPHGRPIILRIGLEEIERGFHRR